MAKRTYDLKNVMREETEIVEGLDKPEDEVEPNNIMMDEVDDSWTALLLK